MPKKLVLSLLAVLLLLLIGGGAAGWWYFLRPLEGSAAAYLPAETLLFVEVPDGVATLRHYQSSPLRRLVEHPAIQALLNQSDAASSQALAQADLPVSKTQKEALASGLALLRRDLPLLLRGDSFAALTSIAPGTGGASKAERVHFLLGFHRKALPFAKNDQAASLFQALGAALARDDAAPDAGTADYNGVTYSWLSSKDPSLLGLRLCQARVGDWDVIAWGDRTLFDWIDRTAGRTPKESSLLASPEFLKATVPLERADVMTYFGPDCMGFYASLMEKVDQYQKKNAPPSETASASDGSSSTPAPAAPFTATDFIHKMFPTGHGAAAAFSLTETGANYHGLWTAPHADRAVLDAIYPPKTRFESTAFTSPSTLYFQASSMDIGAYWDFYSKLPGLETLNASLETQVKGLGFDYRANLLDALGGEFALVVDWPQEQDLPDLLMAIGVKSADKFTPLYDKVTATFAPMLGMFGTPETFTAGDYHALTLHLKQSARFSPTLFDGPHFWGLSLRADGAKRLLSPVRPDGGKALTQDAILGPLASGKHGAGLLGIGWVRSGELVRRGWPLVASKVKPLLAAQPPEKTAWVGKFQALPQTGTLLPLLGDWRVVSWSDADALGGDAAWTPQP